MFFKILLFAIIAGYGAYQYDLSSAPRKVLDAEYGSMDTDIRCRKNHETMCKYYMTVKLGREKIEYTFQVPKMYYHSMSEEQRKARRYPVLYKLKKIFPPKVLSLEPKFQAQVDQGIKEDG